MQHRQEPTPPPAAPTLEAVWRAHHRYLLDVAYRMLGSVGEAEDVVQDAFARLLDVDLGEIQDVRGWLVVAVTRRCLDRLRSARSRREVYVGPWLPEPVIPAAEGTDPVDRVTLDDSVRMALLIVLAQLSPAERVAFVLHDVFQFTFEEVATIVGRSPAACRQLASRARRRVRAEPTPGRARVDPAELTRVADRFVAAASGGDLAALLRVLDPDVVGHTDSGGLVPAPRQPIVGHERVAATLLTFLRASRVTLASMPVNGEPGVLAYQDGRLVAVIALEARDGLITHLHAIANPQKLAYVSSILGVRFGPATTWPQSTSPARAG
jgi:RNA polymerase sigma-70 factor (ECF subfamily)